MRISSGNRSKQCGHCSKHSLVPVDRSSIDIDGLLLLVMSENGTAGSGSLKEEEGGLEEKEVVLLKLNIFLEAAS